ncbi:MAG TPA: cytochrome c peroxidase [Blastocatellia bacterium]
MGICADKQGPTPNIVQWLSLFVIAAFSMIALPAIFASTASMSSDTRGKPGSAAAKAELGRRLFAEARFSSPNGDFRNSCSHCHMTDQDPEGMRAYTDFLRRSWVPWRSADPRRDGLRNAPTLLDAARMPRLHLDGEFGSIHDLVRGTLSGRSMGWLPGEEQKAFAQVYAVVLGNTTTREPDSTPVDPARTDLSYAELFKEAYSVDIDAVPPAEVVDLVTRALTDFVAGLKSERNTPYDDFMRLNGLDSSPGADESTLRYSARLLKMLAALQSRGTLKLADGFGNEALAGFRIFLRSDGAPGAGNCAACHVPPFFTDFGFHNVGISQEEYDGVHGAGSFARLTIPDAPAAVRPSDQMRETASADKPGETDLGYWNFVKLDSPERHSGESDSAFLRRMIATFKTPTLRNLAYSQPYMHNGMYPTLEDAVTEIMRAGEMARAGRLRSADEKLARVKIRETDIRTLTTFLSTLNQNLGKTHGAADY